jgi:hypothetical protein
VDAASDPASAPASPSCFLSLLILDESVPRESLVRAIEMLDRLTEDRWGSDEVTEELRVR